MIRDANVYIYFVNGGWNSVRSSSGYSKRLNCAQAHLYLSTIKTLRQSLSVPQLAVWQ